MATQQLVTWLKRTMASDTNSIAIYQYGHEDGLYREMIFVCLHAGLLEYQEHDTDVIYYTLTDNGKRALELADSEGEQSSTPQAATVPTGEYHTGYDMDGSIVLLDGQKRILMSEPDYETEIMERVAILLNDATHAHREQNAKLQAELQALNAELDKTDKLLQECGQRNRALYHTLRDTYLHLTFGDDTAEYKIQNALEDLTPHLKDTE